MHSKAPKRILCIHSLACEGRPSLAVIAPTLAAMGCQPVMLPTAVLSTHTGGYGEPARLATEGWCAAALEHYKALELDFDCIYTGYLATEAQVDIALRAFDLWPKALKVTDPVLGDHGRLYAGLPDGLRGRIRALCDRADLVIPNLTEAAFLLGRDPADLPDADAARAMAAELADRYPSVLVTGVPSGDFLLNLGAEAGRQPFTVRRIKVGRSFHGTGDLFGAVTVGALMNDKALSAAADQAADFVADAIAATPADADERAGVWFEPLLGRLIPR